MNEQSGNSGQLAPDAGSGGDARAQVADGVLPPLPIAFFDEFGRGADDRVQDYARAALAARQPSYVQGSDELRARTDSERAAYMEGLEEGKRIAARQPVGVEPVAKLHSDGYWTCEPGRDPFDRFGPNKNAAAISVCAAPPAPAAVPVDDTKRKDLIYRLYMARDMQRAGGWSYLFAEAADALEATHPQPAAAKDGA
ncbi:hypothetical protein ACDJ03_19680 [Xanthomonas axonopodis pv. nakataecorchori]|uniref:hypothetical protein n=1 Tax=Xanthomonas axonopodis TaxID=53413 RepID=UPI0035306607